MATFHFELVSPERLLFSGEVDAVEAPGSEGDFTVLANHAPFLTTLRPGIVIVTAGGKTERLYVRGGFAEVNPDGLTILAERAVPMSELDETRLAAEIKDAEDDVADAVTEQARQKAQQRLDRLKEVRTILLDARVPGAAH